MRKASSVRSRDKALEEVQTKGCRKTIMKPCPLTRTLLRRTPQHSTQWSMVQRSHLPSSKNRLAIRRTCFTRGRNVAISMHPIQARKSQSNVLTKIRLHLHRSQGIQGVRRREFSRQPYKANIRSLKHLNQLEAPNLGRKTTHN